MHRDKIQAMILDLLNWIDYDIAKQYDTNTSEDPENAEESMESLIDIVEEYL